MTDTLAPRTAVLQNLLDLVIVVAGWLPHIVQTNTNSLRVFRLLRPLRTINRLPGLRIVVTTLLNAAPNLGGMVVMLAFFFFMFSVIGVQLWAGRWRQRCMDADNAYCDIDKCGFGGNMSAWRASCACMAGVECSKENLNVCPCLTLWHPARI